MDRDAALLYFEIYASHPCKQLAFREEGGLNTAARPKTIALSSAFNSRLDRVQIVKHGVLQCSEDSCRLSREFMSYQIDIATNVDSRDSRFKSARGPFFCMCILDVGQGRIRIESSLTKFIPLSNSVQKVE